MKSKIEVPSGKRKNLIKLFLFFMLSSIIFFGCPQQKRQPPHLGDPSMGHNDGDKIGPGSCDYEFGPGLPPLKIICSGSHSSSRHSDSGLDHLHTGVSPVTIIPVIKVDGVDISTLGTTLDTDYQVSRGTSNGPFDTAIISNIDSECLDAGENIDISQGVKALVLKKGSYLDDGTVKFPKADFVAELSINGLSPGDHILEVTFYFVTLPDPIDGHIHCGVERSTIKVCYIDYQQLLDTDDLKQYLDSVIPGKEPENGKLKYKVESDSNGIEIKTFVVDNEGNIQ